MKEMKAVCRLTLGEGGKHGGMNGWKGLLMALLLLWPCCGLGITANDVTTPRLGMAVAAPQGIEETVPLYSDADEYGDVRMRYYSGTRVCVTDLLCGGMVAVTVGAEEAEVSGYMRASDLRYGPLAVRKVPRCVVQMRAADSIPVRAAPKPGAPVLWTLKPQEICQVMGIGDEKWVQIAPLWYEDEMVLLGSADGQENLQGFAQIPKTAQEGQIQALDDFFVPPCEGELDFGQAYARAIEVVLDGGYDPNGMLMRLPDVYHSEKGLRGLRAQIGLCYRVQSAEAYWSVCFDGATESLQICLSPDGERVLLIMPGQG